MIVEVASADSSAVMSDRVFECPTPLCALRDTQEELGTVGAGPAKGKSGIAANPSNPQAQKHGQ
jgi:hypothetical protein